MLVGLSIRDIVLIDKLELEFDSGLWALTGETGAGKTILLDALGLATGGRADRSLIRGGQKQGLAAAEFAIEPCHPAWTVLERHGLGTGPQLILRRVQTADGRSRAFVNDQPVSVSILKEIGDWLIEVHGQQDDRVLFNTGLHRDLLDAFGGLRSLARRVGLAHGELEASRKMLTEEEERIRAILAESDTLQHAVEEIDRLSPAVDEEQKLDDERRLMMSAEKVSSALDEARRALDDDGGVTERLSSALKRLERIADDAQSYLKPLITALDRALIEAQDAADTVHNAVETFKFDPSRLRTVEERLFALRALSRKHGVAVSELGLLRDRLALRLTEAGRGRDVLETLRAEVEKCQKSFLALAAELSEMRRDAAGRLDHAVSKELKPLKLENATFRTRVDVLDGGDAGPHGLDRVRFEVSTSPGAPLGPLTQIASGGELSRFVLALKVAIARKGAATTLIFDEVDRGIGGAVADAVGERLQRLAQDGQILIVTHSPQVAARATRHIRVDKKSMGGNRSVALVSILNRRQRQEEIARMLSAANITGEARAAAQSLLSG